MLAESKEERVFIHRFHRLEEWLRENLCNLWIIIFFFVTDRK